MKGSMRLVTFGVLVGSLLLAGCSYKPARFQPAEIRTQPIVEIDGGHGHRHYSHERRYRDRDGYRYREEYRHKDGYRRGFCPPGQAKKGRC